VFRLFSLLGVFMLAGPAYAADIPKIDIAQPQSPPKPLPDGMKFVDQGQFNPLLKGYKTPDGFRLDIVSTEPTIVNPVGMTFDSSGTLFVLEWKPHDGAGFPEFKETFKYQDGTTRQIATMKKKSKDVLKVLRYNAEKKIYDKSELVLEDELPSSILVHDGWIYLSGRATVRRYKQSKEGGPYDVKEIIAQGFCGFHHHQVSGMTIGNDGWLYLTSGDDDNFVEGSDGSRATVLRTGAIFRCRPDGSKMHVFSIGWRNPYRDLAFDANMNWFHVDNDNEDGSKFTGCRLMHVAEDADYGWRLFPGARCCRPDMVRGAVYGESPGKLPPMLKTGRGSPAGLLIYNDTRLPEFYRGLLYYPDVFRKVIRAYAVEPSGSTFQVIGEFEFLKSEDPLFRPCQMITGPDGAIYICDWRTDSGGAGKLWGDNIHGRIYRMRWVGGIAPGDKEPQAEIPLRGMDSWSKILKLNDDELLKTLEAPDLSDRLVAQGEIRKRGDKFRAPLIALLTTKDKPLAARIAALGCLQSFWNADVMTAFGAMMTDSQPDLRRLAADGLGLNAVPGDKVATGMLLKGLSDPEPIVKRAVALALGRINEESAAGYLVNLYKFDDGEDVYLTDGLLRAIERTGDRGMNELLILANSGEGKTFDKVVAGFLTMRSAAAAKALPELLKNVHLKDGQRAQLLRSFTNYQFDPPLSVEPIVDYLITSETKSSDVLNAGIEVIANTGDLKGAKIANFLTELLDSTDDKLRLTVISAIETNRIASATSRMGQTLVKKDRPIEERIAIVKAFRVLNDKSVIPMLEEVLKTSEKPEPVALRQEALRTLGVLDFAKTFAVAEKLLDQPDVTLQGEAINVLGSQPQGAKIVGQQFLAKKLSRSLIPQVSDALRRHNKDPEISKMLGEVMKGGLTLSNEPAEIERIRGLVTMKGDPMRGRALFLNSTTLACIKCHKLEGVGGAIGPDLTRVWDTSTIEKIIETIVQPSKEIKEGYQTYIVETKKGLVFSGLKVIDLPKEIVIREASGRDVRIMREDIDEISQSKVSLMPENVVSELNFDQFLDLVAFLKNRQAQESLRGMALDFHVVGPFGTDFTAKFPPEENADPTAVYDKLKWQPLSANANGFLDLSVPFGKTGNSAYALTYVFSPKAQDVTMLYGSDDMSHVWVNGKHVHQNDSPRTAAPDQDKVKLSLVEGWNPVLVRVINRADSWGVYMRFQGEGLRVSPRKE